MTIAKRLFLFVFASFFLFACNNEQSGNENESGGPTDTDTTASSEEAPEELPPANEAARHGKKELVDYAGIIIGDGVRGREKPNTKAEVVTQFNTGQLLRTDDRTHERMALPGAKGCDEYGYYWYSLEGQKGQASWVYGQFYFELLREDYESSAVDDKDLPFYKSFSFNGKDYEFCTATDVGYGPSDSEGLTGCDYIFVSFFYDEEAEQAMLIHYDPEQFPDAEDLNRQSSGFGHDLMVLTAGGEGGSDEIIRINNTTWEGTEALEIEMMHFYQDGSSEGKAYVTLEDGKWQVIAYTNTGTQF